MMSFIYRQLSKITTYYYSILNYDHNNKDHIELTREEYRYTFGKTNDHVSEHKETWDLRTKNLTEFYSDWEYEVEGMTGYEKYHIDDESGDRLYECYVKDNEYRKFDKVPESIYQICIRKNITQDTPLEFTIHKRKDWGGYDESEGEKILSFSGDEDIMMLTMTYGVMPPVDFSRITYGKKDMWDTKIPSTLEIYIYHILDGILMSISEVSNMIHKMKFMEENGRLPPDEDDEEEENNAS